jgi:hypothetical protein
MIRKRSFFVFLFVLSLAALALSGCRPFLQIASTEGSAPTPVENVGPGGVDNPDVFVDPATFRPALIQALNDRDTARLQMWMAEPFLAGAWRGDLSDTSPAEAIKSLTTEQLGAGSRVELVEGADLIALMGGKDPLTIPRSEAGVVDAFLVSGWGKDGRDEAVLFLSRGPADEIQWRGWLLIPGGFSGARLGGIQAYQNDGMGFSLYLPEGYEASTPDPSEVFIQAPGEGHPGETRAAAFIFVEAANGRSAEQVVEAVKTELGSGFNLSTSAMNLDGEEALVVRGLPGQDTNRQVFVVHDDVLYKLMFVPDSPRAPAYLQMEDAYAMVTNTFHFTK